jgi:hypothetical protein
MYEKAFEVNGEKRHVHVREKSFPNASSPEERVRVRKAL